MSQTLTLALPDDVHRRLLDLSRRRGESPEALAQALVADAIRRADGGPEAAGRTNGAVASPEEFERQLDELSAGLPPLPPLPADFARADAYGEHD